VASTFSMGFPICLNALFFALGVLDRLTDLGIANAGTLFFYTAFV